MTEATLVTIKLEEDIKNWEEFNKLLDSLPYTLMFVSRGDISMAHILFTNGGVLKAGKTINICHLGKPKE